ncbi:hypothetical protein DVH24_024219 [Malus domestica]|uniref:Uncharacterized protein n=1 Tax=Malus domestica TaxID=3750 RepID=A0A498JHZ4_MALDO|nr:hypothetical protein DVH24_024219 [Malus domestica]
MEATLETPWTGGATPGATPFAAHQLFDERSSVWADKTTSFWARFKQKKMPSVSWAGLNKNKNTKRVLSTLFCTEPYFCAFANVELERRILNKDFGVAGRAILPRPDEMTICMPFLLKKISRCACYP